VFLADVGFCQEMDTRAVASIQPQRRFSCHLLVAVLSMLAFLPRCLGQISSNEQNDLVAQASEARMQNDVPRAIELYAQAVARNPSWSDGWWFLGSLQYGTGAYAAARDALSHYVELVPGAGPAFALRGLCEY
jgi:cytochrome c-type biogenesis protein CcmH/NrfG